MSNFDSGTPSAIFGTPKIAKNTHFFSRLSENFPDHPENIQSGSFSGYPETFRTIRKILGLSGDFPDHLENIRTIRRLSGPSGKYPDYPENIQTIRKLSGPLRNFPDGLETSQCNFKGYAQKLSGRAKTFRMAMPRCHDGFWASG